MVSNTGNFPKPFAVKYHAKVFQTAMPAKSVGLMFGRLPEFYSERRDI
jgi:hypothetical protein